MTANPDVEITIDGRTRPMRARTATADEKAELWPQIVARYKGYSTYQRSMRWKLGATTSSDHRSSSRGPVR